MTKRKTHRELVEIIDHFSLNWKNKAKLISKIFEEKEDAVEIYLKIIAKHQKPAIRKGAASVLGYLEEITFADDLVPLIMIEPEWSVRYAIAQCLRKHLGASVLEKIQTHYKDSLSNSEEQQKPISRIVFTEIVGALGLKEGMPILENLLTEVGRNRDKQSVELLQQILYAMGEIGDKTTVHLLLSYSANNPYNPKNIQKSAEHALNKIAKRHGFVAKKDLLEKMNEEVE